MAQDRTSEFRAAVQSQVRIHGRPSAAGSAPVSKSEFSARAAAIAKDIAETTEMLGHLTQLARRKPMLDDRPQEVAELTAVIKQRLSRVNDAIRGLQRVPEDPGSKWASTNSKTQLQDHTRNVVMVLQGKLGDVTANFTQVLEDRTKTMQQVQRPISAPRAKPDNPLYKSRAGYSENPYGSGAEPRDGPPDLLDLPQEQSLTLLEDQQSSYLQSRSTAVDTIEKTINELGGIFAQLSQMVAEQRETVQRIDANTDDIALNVSGAHRELLKFYSRVSSNRWLMLKSFGIILVFFFLWVLIS